MSAPSTQRPVGCGGSKSRRDRPPTDVEAFAPDAPALSADDATLEGTAPADAALDGAVPEGSAADGSPPLTR